MKKKYFLSATTKKKPNFFRFLEKKKPFLENGLGFGYKRQRDVVKVTIMEHHA